MRIRRLAIALVLAGCGSSTLDAGKNPDGFSTTPGRSILVQGVTQVTLTEMGGGLHVLPPAGAACDLGHDVYTVDFTDRTLAASSCQVKGVYNDPASYMPFVGVVPLDDAQWTSVQAAVAAVTVTEGTRCGADAESRNLVVTNGSASITYGDDFYGCQKQYSQYVDFDDLNELQNALSGMLP